LVAGPTYGKIGDVKKGRDRLISLPESSLAKSIRVSQIEFNDAAEEAAVRYSPR
jgi:hypothetical protein